MRTSKRVGCRRLAACALVGASTVAGAIGCGGVADPMVTLDATGVDAELSDARMADRAFDSKADSPGGDSASDFSSRDSDADASASDATNVMSTDSSSDAGVNEGADAGGAEVETGADAGNVTADATVESGVDAGRVTADATVESGAEAGDAALEAWSDSAIDSGPLGDTSIDAISEAAGPCASVTPVPCVNSVTNASDFCLGGGACGSCTDVKDDVHCASAYGGAGHSVLCLAGACTPGDCRGNADCAASLNGSLCGVALPHFCGRCTTDSQCASGSPATPVCNTGTGQCAVGTCPTSVTNPPAACPVNPLDLCCGATCQAGRTSNSCCPGAGASTYCAAVLGTSHATCVNSMCASCPAAAGANYFVDPKHGSDASGTGDGTTSGCAFMTVTHALRAIGSPALATTITVLGPSTVSSGETFPLTLPQNVTLTTSTAAVTINVPPGKSGIVLTAPSSGVIGAASAPLTISGQANVAAYGIMADTGSQTSTSIEGVTISGFLQDGILVEDAGALTIGPGVTSTLNGTVLARKAGLHVTGSGEAVIDVPSGASPTHFDRNTNHGILVEVNGAISLTGTIIDGTQGTGTITTTGNYAAGIWIDQTPGMPPQNVISGLVAFGSTNGNGIRIVAGSNVKLRNSSSLGNQGSGVLVTDTAASSDISMIDLGNPVGPDYGNNILQALVGSGANGASGICLEVRASSGILLAAGNLFGGATCATSPATLTINKAGCGSAASCGGVCDLGMTGLGNDIDVATCVHP